MDVSQQIEKALHLAVNEITVAPSPARLASALNYAMFPGGARVRPKLVMAVAQACGDVSTTLVREAAVAIEMLHCASLIQDDLSCFDDASCRRGKPCLHIEFDDRLAILASDGLIVAAFERVSSVVHADAQAQLKLIRMLAHKVGAVHGITAGQAWECEEEIDTEAYHCAKTGALFAASTQAGAIAVGVDSAPWELTGNLLGCAYQIADDIQDVLGDSTKLGKPTNVDAKHGRPNVVHELGAEKAIAHLQDQIDQVIASVPACNNANFFIETIRHEAQRFLPKEIALSAA